MWQAHECSLWNELSKYRWVGGRNLKGVGDLRLKREIRKSIEATPEEQYKFKGLPLLTCLVQTRLQFAKLKYQSKDRQWSTQRKGQAKKMCPKCPDKGARWMCFIVIFAINLSKSCHLHTLLVNLLRHFSFPPYSVGWASKILGYYSSYALDWVSEWVLLLYIFDVVSITWWVRKWLCRSNRVNISFSAASAGLNWMLGPYLISAKLECMQIICSSQCSQLAIICNSSAWYTLLKGCL